MTEGQIREVSWRSLKKRGFRRIVPHGRRAQLRALYNRATWWLYVGSNVRCNCCDTQFRQFRAYFADNGHRALMCPRCGSLGRHRVDWLYLTNHTSALDGPIRILHIAPEVCLEGPLRRLSNVEYLSADYDSTLAMDQVDVRSIHYEDERFDGVICNHVLQLIDDDRTAMKELYRILKPGGWGMIQSSVDPSQGRTADQPKRPPDEPERYEEVFMRIYGRDYRDRLEDAGFHVTVSDFVKQLSPGLQRQLGVDLDETIFFCQKPPLERPEGYLRSSPGQSIPEQAITGNNHPE